MKRLPCIFCKSVVKITCDGETVGFKNTKHLKQGFYLRHTYNFTIFKYARSDNCSEKQHFVSIKRRELLGEMINSYD